MSKPKPRPGTVGYEALLDQSDAAITDLSRQYEQGTWPPPSEPEQTGGAR